MFNRKYEKENSGKLQTFENIADRNVLCDNRKIHDNIIPK